MTARARVQAVAVAAVVLLSMVTTGAAFAGPTIAQSNAPDNPGGADTGGNSDNGGGADTGSNSDNGGGADTGSNSDNGGGADTGSNSDNGGGADTGGNSDNGGGADNAGGGAAGGNSDSSTDNAGGAGGPGTDTLGANAGNGTNGPGVDDAGPPANEQAADGANGTGPDIVTVRRQVSQATPDAAAEVPIEDTDPDTPGLTVDTSRETPSVSSVTLADEELRGSVGIEEYSEPPESVSQSVAATVTRNRGPNPASDGDTDDDGAAESADNASTATDRVSVLTVANISVFDETGEEASSANATVQMRVDADDVDDPESAVVVHETDDGWEELETSVANVTNESVTLAAETGGFSLFAVAEITADDGASPETAVQEPTDDSTPGFGLWVAVAALFGIVVAAIAGVVLPSQRPRR